MGSDPWAGFGQGGPLQKISRNQIAKALTSQQALGGTPEEEIKNYYSLVCLHGWIAGFRLLPE